MGAYRRRPALAVAGVLGAAVLTLSGCGSDAGPAAADGTIAVVASTNVWGSVVSAVGGDQVSVDAIIEDPSGDPHSYENTAADGLAVSEAELLVHNGGGYDDFAGRLAAEHAKDIPVIEAFAISGHGEGAGAGEAGHAEEEAGHAEEEAGHAEEEAGHAEEEAGHAEEEAGHAEESGHDHGANEHVWYDLPTVSKVADEVAKRLGELRPEQAKAFTDRAAGFKRELDAVAERLAEIGAAKPGASVLATEPVAHYLLDGAKLTDATPEAFSRAIEAETDVPVAAQDEVNRLIDGKKIAVLVNNPQTETPVTQQVLAKARDAGVPVVDITETLPEGKTDFLTWIRDEVDALAAAVGR